MKIAIIGSGGREHALAMAMAESPASTSVIVVPGNPGMLSNEKISISSTPIKDLVKEITIDLVVVGPEAPLAEGIVDDLQAMGINVFGPTKSAAMLESSKIFSKQMMLEAGVPTAEFKVANNQKEAIAAINELADQSGIVLKADGLASGKGVVVCDNKEAAIDASLVLFEKYQGPLLIEKRVKGIEVSALFLCLDKEFLCLGSACDHKRLLDNDKGPNTGGMGTFSPVPWLSKELLNRIESEVITPTLNLMETRRTPFRGMLFAGLMIDGDKINVLEFNVRFGDPETQAILPILEWDAVVAFNSVATGDSSAFKKLSIKPTSESCVHVVKASSGYPERPILGRKISVKALPENSRVYFAGVKALEENLVTNGGRVLGVSAVGADLKSARKLAYEAIENLDFDGAIYRRDIGVRHD